MRYSNWQSAGKSIYAQWKNVDLKPTQPHSITLYLRKFMNAIFTENLFKNFAGKRFEPYESSERDYKVTMRLTIHSVTQNDFGSYRCVSKNSLGDTDGQIKLYRKYLCYVCRHNNYFYYFHRIIAISVYIHKEIYCIKLNAFVCCS